MRLPVRLRPARSDLELERDRFVRPRLGDAVREVDIGSNLDLDSSMIVDCGKRRDDKQEDMAVLLLNYLINDTQSGRV